MQDRLVADIESLPGKRFPQMRFQADLVRAGNLRRTARAIGLAAPTAPDRLDGAAIALHLSFEQRADDWIGLGQALADLGPVYGEQNAIIDRDRSGGARSAVEDRHLAEHVPSLQATEHDPRAHAP